ncbi:hypothetical protein Tco_1190751 [Tanacetum coccineum]
MLTKQNDPISKEKKINISLNNYTELNKLAEDFGKRFVPKKELSAEQTFWLLISNPISEQLVVQTTSIRTEAPSELPKIDKNSFNKWTLMEAAIEQYVMNIVMHADFVHVNVLSASNKCLVNDNLESERLIQENDHLFELLLSQDIVQICVNSLATLTNYAKIEQDYIDEYSENLVLKAELAKKEQMVEKKFFDEVVLSCSRLKNHNVNLELELQHQKESFLNNRPLNNQNALEILEIFKINEWQAKLDAKDVSIANLRKHIESLKGKNVVEKVVQPNNANVIALGMFKLDLEPLSPKVLKNTDAHIDYIKHTQENADILRELVEHARALRPLDSDLDSACKYAKRIQEVLVYVTATCPSLPKPSEKLVAITPLNKNKKVRFTEPATSSSNTQKQVDSHKTQDSNKPILPSTGMKSSIRASISQPSGNTKNNRISQTTSSNMKNKVEDHSRNVKSNSNKTNRVSEPVCNANVKHTMLNVNSKLICVKCNRCMFDANHDLCFLDFVNDVNVRSKSKSAKSSKNKKTWKPTGKIFTDIGYKWKPTGRTFTLAGNMCPLTRITSTKVEPLMETTSKSVTNPNPEIKIYRRKTKVAKSVDLSSEPSILGSRPTNILEPNKYWGSTVSNSPSTSLVNFRLSKLFSGTVRFGNDQIAKIMGYGDYQLGNATILRVYYVEGLRHKLFSVGQFCDSDLEFAFRKHTCYVQNLDDTDLIFGP